jgi:hypothetical protein
MKTTLRAAALVCAAFLAACDPGGPARPQPGDLTVAVATPNTDDRAMVITISGPQPPTDVQPATPDYVVHSRIVGSSARVAVFGLIANGPVLKVSVPDLRQARSYTATLVEAVDVRNVPRASTAGYTVTLKR